MTSRGGWVRLAIVGLGLSQALGIAAPSTTAAAPPASGPRPIYHKSRSFRVPFNINPDERDRYKQVQLWVSDDGGENWRPKSTATPDRPAFAFRAERDAEYWFAVRTLDTKGRLYPGDDEPVDPKLKVIVDTKPPSLTLEPKGRRGSVAGVRWEVGDEHLDPKSLILEYKVGGVNEWRRVRVRRPALIGSETWDAGTAEPVRVRMSVADRAGNVAEASVDLPEGTAANPHLAASEPAESAPPPISQISSGPTLPPADEAPAGAESQDPFPAPAPSPAPEGPAPDAGDSSDPFPGVAGATDPAPADEGDRAPAEGRSRALVVRSPRFPLQYAVDDAGPDGPSTVELWITRDGGRSWARKGVDPDRTSPFPVDVGGEGTFGLCLVARSASGLGDQPPAAGDPPQFWVEVDSTPPAIQMLPPRVGNGQHTGKLAIDWRATDLHLRPRPVTLSWRPDKPGARWIPITPSPIENTGPYVWTLPANVPSRFHIRIDVVDEAGNRGMAETTETGPVLVDRTRPRSRIIGLDPSARAGGDTSSRSLR